MVSGCQMVQSVSARGQVAIGSDHQGFEATLGTICSFSVQEQEGTSPRLIENIERPSFTQVLLMYASEREAASR